jgi:hypothetical protein
MSPSIIFWFQNKMPTMPFFQITVAGQDRKRQVADASEFTR